MWTAKSTPASRHHSVLTRIVEAPARAMAAILFLHAVVWTALPSLLYANLPLDLIEALTYGREWQLGYDKLPPLPWWLVEIAYRLFGHDFAYYLLAQIAVVAALWLIWLTRTAARRPARCAGRGADRRWPALSQLQSTKFNHDVVQLPFWALAGFAFHRALRGGWIGHWLLARLRDWNVAVVEILRGGARRTPRHYSFSTTARHAKSWQHRVLTSRSWRRSLQWRRISSGSCRMIFCRSLTPNIARCPRADWSTTSGIRLQFGIGQAFFLVPSLLIALPLFFPRQTRQ
mgnify:CR=1 FL=1